MKFQVKRLWYTDGIKYTISEFENKQDALKCLWQDFAVAKERYQEVYMHSESYVVWFDDNALFTCYICCK